MTSEDDNTAKNTATSSQPQQQQYGTFQGVANFPPPRPQQPQHASYPPPRPPQHQHNHPYPIVGGFPQPMPPPGATQQGHNAHYSHGYQTVPGYAVAEGHPVRQQRLPCCGCGLGWFLFITGWFFAAIPWYLGALVILCNKRIDPREKPGYVACTIAAILATIAIVFGATKGADEW